MTATDEHLRKETKPMSKPRTPIRAVIGTASLAALLVLSACGGENSDTATDTSTETSTETASPPSDTPGGGMNADQIEEIQACLKAAGLEDKFPTDRPSGAPSDLPSDMPTDLPSDAPSGAPSDLPSDFPTDLGSGAPGDGGAGVFQDPEVQDALRACGIELPQAPGEE